MRITVLVELTDARRSYTAGELVEDMPEDQAHRWITAGWAVALDSAPETATLAPAPETGTLPRGRKR